MQKQEKSLWYILLTVLETNVIKIKIYPLNIRRADYLLKTEHIYKEDEVITNCISFSIN
jgi:hypothetical protein